MLLPNYPELLSTTFVQIYVIIIVRLYICIVFINIEIIYVTYYHCEIIDFNIFTVHSPDIDCLIHVKNMRITYISNRFSTFKNIS